VDEHATVIEVMVIHEVPVIEVTVIELPTSKSGATMEGVAGKATHMATHATNMTTAHATHVGAESTHMTAKPATSHMTAAEPATSTVADERDGANFGHSIFKVRRTLRLSWPHHQRGQEHAAREGSHCG
jgi:hypothetical protein